MTFIICLIALVLERFFHWHHLRHWHWFRSYEKWLNTLVGKRYPFGAFLLNVIPVLAAVLLAQWLLKGWLYGLLLFIFELAILLYCLGPSNLWVQIYQGIHQLNQQHPQLALQDAEMALGQADVADAPGYHHSFVRSIFKAAEHRIFGVIFWFVLLGPVGAVLYRLLQTLSTMSVTGVTQQATQAMKALDWLPIRCFTLIFALAGNFTETFSLWKAKLRQGIASNDKLLCDCGVAALGLDDEAKIPPGLAEEAAIALLDRVFVIWLVILAVLVLIF